VRLPKRDDFPEIGYLTADEVEREVERLRGLDLSYPASAEIEAERRAFSRRLRKAAAKRAGVVSFYY
jgi:hypothetical protein